MWDKTMLQTLLLLWSLNIEFGVATTQSDGSELLHSMLARILAKVDATRNFVIAPQELLALYEQMYGDVEDGFDAGTNDAQEHEEIAVDNGGNSNALEYDEFFGVGPSAIVVANVMRAEVYAAKRFTRKLKNLQFVLREEEDDEDKEDDKKNSDIDDGVGNRNKKFSAASRHDERQVRRQQLHGQNNSNKYNELINAVHINSRWAHNFQRRDTHKRQFHMTPETHAYVNTMRKDDIFPYAELPQLNASALELSLQQNGLKMLVLLPHAADGLPQLLQQLSANVSLIAAISDTRQQLRPTLVRCFLPKFQFTQRTDVGAVFRELVNTSRNRAAAMALANTWKVTHEAKIAVNENGIGALERTTVVLFWNAFSSLRSVPLKFRAEHPFLFIVYNRMGMQLLGYLTELHG